MGGTEHPESAMLTRRHAERERDAGRRVRITLMFTDIVASTVLLNAIGDDAWSVLLHWHDATLRRLFIQHGGQEVKQVGDGFFAVFGDTHAAIACALDIQETLSASRRAGHLTPQVRIGVHEAEVTQTSGDFIGRGVHEAARIAALGEADEVVTSARTLARACNGFPAHRPRTATLRGFQDPVELVSVGAELAG
jgi:class 3 adenylate cyclase